MVVVGFHRPPLNEKQILSLRLKKKGVVLAKPKFTGKLLETHTKHAYMWEVTDDKNSGENIKHHTRYRIEENHLVQGSVANPRATELHFSMYWWKCVCAGKALSWTRLYKESWASTELTLYRINLCIHGQLNRSLYPAAKQNTYSNLKHICWCSKFPSVWQKTTNRQSCARKALHLIGKTQKQIQQICLALSSVSTCFYVLKSEWKMSQYVRKRLRKGLEPLLLLPLWYIIENYHLTWPG